MDYSINSQPNLRLMKSLILCIFLLFNSFLSLSQNKRPKLVVGIVVDQMRQEYLLRYESKFTEDGFKKLMSEGFNAKNTHYNYIPTYTAPGHAAIYTGTTPRYNGIISNSWYSREADRSTYCVGDAAANNIGGSKNAGKISPKNLIVNTITDELKLSTNFQSKIVGVSIKDRGAVLPAGHTPDGAYWYDSRTGEFMTSDYYTSELPEWVVRFNNEKRVDRYSNQVWKPLLPLDQYIESTPDNSPYEGGFKGKETPTFPYDLKKLRIENGPYGMISSTPFGNTLIFDMGKAAIEGEKMGEDDVTDFLALSFSSPDYIGHNFGPNSIEVEDTYLRLDRELGAFITYLDEKVGKGAYTIFLTSDHGVVANPQFLLDNKLPGGYIDMEAAGAAFQQAVVDVFGEGEWILDVSNDQIYLDRAQIAQTDLSLEEAQRKIADIILSLDPVAEAFTATDLSRMDYSDPMRKLIQNGYNRKLSGDVLILLKPGYLPDTYGRKGTSHGTGYTYDTHVPLLFYGKGIVPGFTVRKTTITDIAPTLALLLDISMPNAAVTGEPITEIFE